MENNGRSKNWNWETKVYNWEIKRVCEGCNMMEQKK